MFFVLKDFDQSQELKTIAKKSLQFYMFPTYDFFVIKTETRFCYMEDGWKERMNICTALWSFVNFCCLSQSEVSTDNRKVSTFFAFQHVCCRCCYRSYLDHFLNNTWWWYLLFLCWYTVLSTIPKSKESCLLFQVDDIRAAVKIMLVQDHYLFPVPIFILTIRPSAI